jgi:hypothetical protein
MSSHESKAGCNNGLYRQAMDYLWNYPDAIRNCLCGSFVSSAQNPSSAEHISISFHQPTFLSNALFMTRIPSEPSEAPSSETSSLYHRIRSSRRALNALTSSLSSSLLSRSQSEGSGMR